MTRYSVFIIDDDKLICEAAEMGLRKTYRVTSFTTAEASIAAIESDLPDLILLDIQLPGLNGIEALKKLKPKYPNILVIMITAIRDIPTVVTAMKLGAYDYVVKPIDMDVLKNTIRNGLESVRMRREILRLQEKCLNENVPFFIVESNAIQEVMSLVNKVAMSPEGSVLIVGETGTGKELIASTIHFRSPNFRGPFLTLNCSALPDNLVESELFGYEKGAFSGADPAGKQGLIEAAAGGTLFLDEVADLSLGAQAKLLRFLESGEYFKIGGVRKYAVKTRVVAATNKDIENLVEQGLFRKDLYYRLAAIRIAVPNLKDRPADILPIAQYFLIKFAEKLGRTFSGILPEAETALRNHDYKGNVRELRNIIERAVLIGPGPKIRFEDLGIPATGSLSLNLPESSAANHPSFDRFSPIPDNGLDLPHLHQTMDTYYIRQSLEKARGNYTHAAELLKMSYFSFRRRKDKLGI